MCRSAHYRGKVASKSTTVSHTWERCCLGCTYDAAGGRKARLLIRADQDTTQQFTADSLNNYWMPAERHSVTVPSRAAGVKIQAHNSTQK
eukprot:6175048-Pleurochrysis_carterae.AAC.1